MSYKKLYDEHNDFHPLLEEALDKLAERFSLEVYSLIDANCGWANLSPLEKRRLREDMVEEVNIKMLFGFPK